MQTIIAKGIETMAQARNTEDLLQEQVEVLQEQIDDLKAQCDAVHKKLGWPSWTIEKRQRLDNAKAAGTKTPFNPGDFVYRPKAHEVKND
jgi:hypothetical protein